jgi:hypothetical protein
MTVAAAIVLPIAWAAGRYGSTDADDLSVEEQVVEAMQGDGKRRLGRPAPGGSVGTHRLIAGYDQLYGWKPT